MQRRSINLTFHGIGEQENRLERGEEDVWLSISRFLSVLDGVATRSDVRITFDDGYASDVEHALPALRLRGLTATFFVVAGRLGAPGFLDEDGVRTLAAAGMRIGSHGMRHRPWRQLDDGELREELVDSKRRLEAIVERPVTQAACPFGSYDRRVLRTLRRCAYEHVYTSDRGTSRAEDWIQTRNTVRRGDGADLVEHILSSERSWDYPLRRRAKLVAKRWR